MQAHQLVESADGTRLAVYRAWTGTPGAELPVVLLVHGWAQSVSCWHRQFADPDLTARCCLAATDLRGHGRSDASTGGYGEPSAWAADLAAVLAALPDRPVVVVGWSYGGLVIADYVAGCGLARLAGIVLVGAITGIGRGQPAGRIGPAMRAALPAALDEDPAVAAPALAAFVHGMTPCPLPAVDAQRLLDTALATPARVRRALFDRTADGAGFVTALRDAAAKRDAARPVPVLVLHGTRDPVVDVATAEHHLATIPGARADWWQGTGHVPFVEDEHRFAAALSGFARRCLDERTPT